MTDVSPHESWPKSAFEVVLARQIKEDRGIVKSELQSAPHQAAVIRQDFTANRGAKAQRDALNSFRSHPFDTLMDHERDQTPRRVEAMSIGFDGPMRPILKGKADEKTFRSSGAVVTFGQKQPTAAPIRWIEATIEEPDFFSLWLGLQAFGSDRANVVQDRIPFGVGIILTAAFGELNFLALAVVELPPDPFVGAACPGQCRQVQEWFFAPFGDLKALLAKQRQIFFGRIVERDDQALPPREFMEFMQQGGTIDSLTKQPTLNVDVATNLGVRDNTFAIT